MKFVYGILLVALVALARAEEAATEIKPEAVSVNEAETTTNVRNRRGLLVSAAYAAPVVAAPVAAAPFAAAPIAAASYAVATPVSYSYSASVPYPYAGYSAYASYAPAVYL